MPLSYQNKWTSAQDAVSLIRSGDGVITPHAAALPSHLLQALTARAAELRDVTIFHLLSLAPAPYCAPGMERSFRFDSIFLSGSTRLAENEGRADYTPVFFHRLPEMLRNRRYRVAMVHVSPPDEQGFCSLGVSVDYTCAAIECAELVIAQVNRHMPRTGGDAVIHVDRLDVLVEHDEPLPALQKPEIGEVERAIGRHCAGLIQDGDTLQLGIGAIPDAVLLFLGEKRDLGIHSEMISDGVMELMRAGVVTNRKKTLDPGKCVIAFAAGSQEFYQFLDGNDAVVMRTVDYVNDPRIVMQQDNMVSINSCLAVDLSGQVCSEALGDKQFSGVGGQVDFVRGANMSRGGRAIMAMPSTAARGTVSRIVAAHPEGAVITTSRNDVDYVVTEYGVAQLFGKTVHERAQALIEIAHPDFRDGLRNAFERKYGRRP